MLTQIAVEEGFKKRKNYKRMVQRTGKVFHFTNDPIGKVVKILIGLIGDSRVGKDLVMRRNFTAQGAGKEALFTELLKFVPWFPEYYRLARGKELTADIVYDRYHKMYYGEGKAMVSKEHYMHHDCLRELVPAVDKLFLAGREISEKEARNIGNLNQPILL